MDLDILSDEEQAIVRGGLQAADLLDNESFISTVRSLQYEWFCQFTEAKTFGEREPLHYKVQALQAIETTLRSRVQQKDAIARRLDAAQAETDEDLI